LVPAFKKWLAGQKFENSGSLKTAIMQCFDSQTPNFFVERLRKLAPNYTKCLEISGNYVEK